jgi:uncharacterized protein YjbI with pentapeptide repeats
MPNADLRRADLRGAKLSRVDFSGSLLSGCNLQSADLYSAKLAESDLTEANLDSSNLERCDLSFCDFTNSSANNTIFLRARLKNAKIHSLKSKGALFSDDDIERFIGELGDDFSRVFGEQKIHTRSNDWDFIEKLLPQLERVSKVGRMRGVDSEDVLAALKLSLMRHGVIDALRKMSKRGLLSYVESEALRVAALITRQGNLSFDDDLDMEEEDDSPAGITKEDAEILEMIPRDDADIMDMFPQEDTSDLRVSSISSAWEEELIDWSDLDGLLIRRDLWKVIRNVVTQDLVRILMYRFVLDYSVDEIAIAVGASVRTVSAKLAKAKDILRRELAALADFAG